MCKPIPFAFVALLCSQVEPAMACSCMPCAQIADGKNVVESDAFDVIVSGLVLSEGRNEHGELEYTIEVIEQLKGQSASIVKVTSEPYWGGSCGEYLPPGHRLRVAAYDRGDGTYHTTKCHQSCWARDFNRSLFSVPLDDDEMWENLDPVITRTDNDWLERLNERDE